MFAHFNNPIEQWHVLPSFVIGELLFIAGAIIALVHARRRGRDHLLIWIAALVAGTANDIIFMALPLVDNFWQAQGTIMLTPRMPLYIPCVYVCFMYFPTVAVRRLALSRWSGAALTGLAAGVFYAPYDIVGAKFLWWTWHDTDQPIAARILGAPVGSTLWVLTFVATFAWLIDHTVRRDPRVSNRSFALGIAKVAGLTTLLMVVQITALQWIDGGAPRYGALAVCAVVYAAVAARGWTSARPRRLDHADRRLLVYVVCYFITLAGIGFAFDPATHRSAGVHQEVGECYVEARDVTGQTRHRYLCARDFDEDYTFGCVDSLPADGATWYTVCGRAHRAPAVWLGGLGGLAIVGIAVFVALLGVRERGRD